MKTIVLALAVSQLALTYSPMARAEKSPCTITKNIAVEYLSWKKNFQKFLTQYETLSPSLRFDKSKLALKDILTEIQTFSEQSTVPMPKSTVEKAKSLLAEVEAGRMAKQTANPILKSSLKKLETSMDEMITKAQWINPTCDIEVKSGRSAIVF